jgi:hypothetical protein
MHRLALALAALSLFAASAARASLAEALSLDELVDRSEHVVHTRALRSSSRFEGNVIVTYTTLEVLETAKGALRSGNTLEVRYLGGVVGDLGMRIEGTPHFTVGEESLVFAATLNAHMTPVGLSQGVMPVRVERGGVRQVLPGGNGLALVSRSRGRLAQAPAAVPSPRPLTDVLAEVRARAGTTR